MAHSPGEGYYSHVRTELVDWLDGVPARVLEVGCGAGRTLAYLRARGCREVVGIELSPQEAERAREHADQICVGDVETMDLPGEPAGYDCMILGDVLEHLRDPWGALARLVGRVKIGGWVVASIPNVRFYEVSLGLVLAGRWEYAEEGILDRTHLRFFTRRSMIGLFQGVGLRVVATRSVYGPKRGILNYVTLGILRDRLARQHLLKGVRIR